MSTESIIFTNQVSIDLETGEVIFGQVDCPGCGYAHEHWGMPIGRKVEFGMITCAKCRGTGRRGNGHCRNCSDTYDRVKSKWEPGKVRHVHKEAAYDAGPCERCDATGKVDATRYDYAPKEVMAAVMAAMPIVIRHRDLSAGERLFGADMIAMHSEALTSFGSITDYGRAHGEALGALATGTYQEWVTTFIAMIRTRIASESRRMTSIILPTNKLISAVVVALGNHGYVVYGVNEHYATEVTS